LRVAPNPQVQVTGTGSCVGERVVDNHALEGLIHGYDATRSGPFGEWVDQVTHIHERPFTGPATRSSDMALEASKKALERASVDPADVDLVIYASFTPSEMIPGDHCILADRLGAKRAGTFNLMGACAGSIYGLGLAYGMVASGAMRHVLVVGAETISPLLNYHDPLTAILFADGAGAALVSRAERGAPGTGMLPPILTFEYSATAIRLGNSNNPHGMRCFAPAEDKPSHALVERALIEMAGGPSVLKNAVLHMAGLTVRTMGYELADLKNGEPTLVESLSKARLVPHQANGRIVDSLADRLGMPPARVIRTIYRYGNMSAASNLVALDFGVRRGNLDRVLDEKGRVLEVRETPDRIEKGDLVLLPSIGGGYVMGCIAFRHSY
jgi:3-oxoacyl-[acyl-carrier-protein] synthase-3